MDVAQYATGPGMELIPEERHNVKGGLPVMTASWARERQLDVRLRVCLRHAGSYCLLNVCGQLVDRLLCALVPHCQETALQQLLVGESLIGAGSNGHEVKAIGQTEAHLIPRHMQC